MHALTWLAPGVAFISSAGLVTLPTLMLKITCLIIEELVNKNLFNQFDLKGTRKENNTHNNLWIQDLAINRLFFLSL